MAEQINTLEELNQVAGIATAPEAEAPGAAGVRIIDAGSA